MAFGWALDAGNVEFLQLIHLLEQLVSSLRLGFIDSSKGEADMHEHIIAGTSIWHRSAAAD